MVSSNVKRFAISSTVSCVALVVLNVAAHQIVLLPEPQWTTNDKETRYNPLAFLENQNFPTSEDFNAYLDEHKYENLRDFMDNANYTVTEGADKACGFTKSDGTPQPIPADDIMRTTGYTHDGPCEAWFDKTMALSGKNCHKEFPGQDHPIDYSLCKESCLLRWYWLGVRFIKNEYSWQVYKACVRLTKSVAKGDGKGV